MTMPLSVYPTSFNEVIDNWREQARQIEQRVSLAHDRGTLTLCVGGETFEFDWPLYRTRGADLLVITPVKLDYTHDLLRWPGEAHLGDELWRVMTHEYGGTIWSLMAENVPLETAVTTVYMECA